MVKKIVLFGSESTGKTTLAKHLALHYNTVWVPEYARLYLEKKGSPCAWEDIEPIARGQIKLEENLYSKAHRILICDTDIRETKVYSYAYFDRCSDFILEEVKKRTYDLYLLLNIDIPWEKDNLRDRPHLRKEMHELFKNELQQNNIAFVEISGDFSEREKQAIEAIDQLLFL